MRPPPSPRTELRAGLKDNIGRSGESIKRQNGEAYQVHIRTTYQPACHDSESAELRDSAQINRTSYTDHSRHIHANPTE